jgi:hypothetical protein
VKRRSFLQMLGLAPAVAVAKELPDEILDAPPDWVKSEPITPENMAEANLYCASAMMCCTATGGMDYEYADLFEMSRPLPGYWRKKVFVG